MLCAQQEISSPSAQVSQPYEKPLAILCRACLNLSFSKIVPFMKQLKCLSDNYTARADFGVIPHQ